MALERKNGICFVDGIAVPEIAKVVGKTPFYLYSANTLRRQLQSWKRHANDFGINLRFSIKSNNNLYLNRIIASEVEGAVVVSAWELELAKLAGYDLRNCLIHGNGKTAEEVKKAIEAGVLISIDSVFDAEQISKCSEELGLEVRALLRINPMIDPHVHPYVATSLSESKFGFTTDKLNLVLETIQRNDLLRIVGLHCHIGSSLQSVAPVLDSLRFLLRLADELEKKGLEIELIDVGGGMGINYFHDDTVYPEPEDYLSALSECARGKKWKLMVEPGRAIVASCGFLVGTVLGVKENGGRNFIVTDASMTELIRPPLYDAYHHIELAQDTLGDEGFFDIVGPVCESADFLGKNRKLSKPSPGNLVIIFDAGAYGYTMSSEYNLRPKPPEVVIDKGKIILTRKPTTLSQVISSFTEEVLE